MDYKKNTIKEFVEMIKGRTAMYIGRKDIFVLKGFFDGWLYGCEGKLEDSHLIGEFQTWIENKFEISSTQDWASIIRFFSADDHVAVDRFFNLWDEFLETNLYELKK